MARRRPPPPSLGGGGGERKTLRLVAQYAQACNLFGQDDLPRKLDILRQHCADVGRDYDDIEKTVQMRFDLGRNGERVDHTIEHLRELGALGIHVAHGGVRNVSEMWPLELMAERVLPDAADF